MTHDTPGEPDERRWCEGCGISVEPVTEDGEPTCPACGAELGSAN